MDVVFTAKSDFGVKKNLMICSILSQINVVIYTCKNDNNDELDI